MLCHWHGICGGWYSSAFLKNAAAFLHSPNFQFRSILSTIVWACSVPSAQSTKVCQHTIKVKNFLNYTYYRFDANTNLLHPSKTLFQKSPSKLTTITLKILAALRLTELTVHPNTGEILECNNLTILNFFLLRLGPMNEKRLVQVLMCSQVCSLVSSI